MTGLVLPERFEAAKTSADGKSADFVMEPLERGFGHTLGNAVRRALLSSLRGSAVWALRSNGLLHEHDTIKSVVEDVHQVVHNLKALVLTLDDGVEEATLTIATRKAGTITAESIRAPASVTIHDPSQHILTLQEDSDLEIELFVNKGRGFVLADEMPAEDDGTGLIRIDAIYNPVLRANFTVQETRVGQRTDFDKLTVRVETNGAMDPREAICSAAALVQRYLGFMLELSSDMSSAEQARSAVVPAHVVDLLEKPIKDVGTLSIPLRNALAEHSVGTLRELVARSREDLLDLENVGEKSLDELAGALEKMDLRLGMKLDKDAEGRLVLLEEPATTDE